MPRKAYTVEEANAALPRLEDIFQRLEAKKAAIRHHDQKLQVLDALWGEALTRATNPDRATFDGHRDRVDELIRDIKEIVEDEILAVGIRFPSGGLEHGLLDFPTTYQGRWVLLCWKRGEPAVGFWHELTGGYDVVKGERVKIKGYLEDFALSKQEADSLIMSARDKIYQD